MKKVQWTFDSEAENNLKLVCVQLNENVPFHESFSRLSVVQTLRDLPYPNPADVPCRTVGLDLQSRPIEYKDFQSATTMALFNVESAQSEDGEREGIADMQINHST